MKIPIIFTTKDTEDTKLQRGKEKALAVAAGGRDEGPSVLKSAIRGEALKASPKATTAFEGFFHNLY